MHKLQIYIDSIRENEPFKQFQICSVRKYYDNNNKQCIEQCNEREKWFYGLYGQREDDNRWMSIADSLNKVELFELATAFNIFAGYTLPITTKFEI